MVARSLLTSYECHLFLTMHSSYNGFLVAHYLTEALAVSVGIPIEAAKIGNENGSSFFALRLILKFLLMS